MEGPVWRRTAIFLLLPHEGAVNRSMKDQTDRCCEVLFFLAQEWRELKAYSIEK